MNENRHNEQGQRLDGETEFVSTHGLILHDDKGLEDRSLPIRVGFNSSLANMSAWLIAGGKRDFHFLNLMRLITGDDLQASVRASNRFDTKR